MVQKKITKLILVSVGMGYFCFPFKPIYAADLEDFIGGVSNTRITSNPASTGLMDRWHLQYSGISYTGEITSRSFLDVITLDGLPATAVAPDGETELSGVHYQKANYTEGKISFVWPFSLFSLGVSTEGKSRSEKDGLYVNRSFQPLDDDTNATDATESFESSKFGLILGIPLNGWAFGIRYLWNEGSYRVSDLNPALFYQEDDISNQALVAQSFPSKPLSIPILKLNMVP